MCKMEILSPDVAYLALNKAAVARGLQQFQIKMASPTSSPEYPAFQKLLRHLYRTSRIELQQVERLRAHLHRLFVLRTTDDAIFLLKCSPSRDTRLLRYEYKSLETEGRILDLIASRCHVPVSRRLYYDPSTNNNIRAPYLLRSYIPGTTLADRLPYLNSAERSDIDRSLGAYFFSLTEIKLGSFGSTSEVYVDRGKASWSDAFRALLESVLRDAEDVLVNLPYDCIRLYASKYKDALDEITEARLVPIDAGRPGKVLLDDRRKHIVGLLGFSNVIWGDPQLAGVFATASEAFWEGYGGRPENTAGHKIRHLLYYVYRSVVAITTPYHRPTADGDDLDARRTLTWALRHLEGQ